MDENITYIVMPLLREFDNPKFGSVNELLDFGDQIFEVSLLYVLSIEVLYRFKLILNTGPSLHA